jgi:type I restriction enzyme, S subunit
MSRERNGEPEGNLPALPQGWCWARVGELGEVRLGRQRSPKNRSEHHPTKYIRAANITWNGLDLSDVLDMDFKPTELEAYRLLPGDVLLSEASGSPGEVGKPAIWRGEMEDCCFQNTVIRFRPKAMPPDFPFVVFCHFARNGVFSKAGKGVGIHHLSADRFSTLSMPLAPLNEQRRIVAKIEELFSDLDAGVAALKRIRANLKRYRAAVLKAAVEGKLTEEWRAKHPKTEPASKLLERILVERRRRWEEGQLTKFAAADKTPPKGWREKYVEPSGPDTSGLPELPQGWAVASLEQLTDVNRPICYGILMPKENVADGVLYVKVKDMKGDRIDLASLHRTRREIADDYSRASLKPGDLLLAIRGTYGRVATVPPELDGGNITQDTARLAISNEMNSEFVATALRSFDCQSFFKRVARGVAVKGVNIGDVKLCPIPIPPLEEQLEIVAEVAEKISQIEAAEVATHHSLKRAGRLRQSILKRAFEGKLVPQDPTDEPADKLLERIRQERTAANGSVALRTRRGRASTQQAEGETEGAAS